MRNSDAATPLGDGRELRIGVDVGGTKIEAVALLPDGYERDRTRIATPHGDYGATVHAIADLIHAMEQAPYRPTRHCRRRHPGYRFAGNRLG